MKKELEKICYWKIYRLEDLDKDIHCFRCRGEYEDRCVWYIGNETVEKVRKRGYRRNEKRRI